MHGTAPHEIDAAVDTHAATSGPVGDRQQNRPEIGHKNGHVGVPLSSAAPDLTDLDGRPVKVRSDLADGLIGYRTVTGVALCAACLCPIDGHCPQCGCLTAKGTSAECRCAKAIVAIATCADCGGQFVHRWQLQVHRMPTPRCLTSARAAGGRFYATPQLTAPLKPKGL